MGILFLILLINRSFPYFLYGPFGFGYDMGIYKKTFEEVLKLSDIFAAPVDVLPSFLAFLFNYLQIPLNYLLYHFHIFASVFLAVPLYLLTREYFGKTPAIVAVGIFSISYVQVFASEFYLFKAVLGASFLLFSFYFYYKKSYLFYLTAFLLALTQLPQLLLLAVGVGIATFFGGKKNFVFNLVGFLVVAAAVAILLVYKSEYFFGALNIIVSSLSGVEEVASHNKGLFMTLPAYLHRSYIIVAAGVIGLLLSLRDKKAIAFQAATVFVLVVVFLKLFFENRFIVELDLLLIPFASFFFVYLVDEVLKNKFVKISASVFLLTVSVGLSYWYYVTTFPALTVYEVWAIDVINERDDAQYDMVTNTLYAPWLYGFSNKETMAPGIFESVWTFDQWVEYTSAGGEEKAKMITDIADKYGKFYLFEGVREPKSGIDEYSERVRKIFEVNGATVFEVLP